MIDRSRISLRSIRATGLAGARDSLAGQPQRRAPPRFAPTQARFGTHDVVAGDRHRALALCKLNLEHHHILASECHFRAGEIKFPHSHKPGVVEAYNLLAVGEETVAPRLERLRVVQTQDL